MQHIPVKHTKEHKKYDTFTIFTHLLIKTAEKTSFTEKHVGITFEEKE